MSGEYCEQCDQFSDEGESVVVGVTRVDGMIVSEDREFVCAACIEEAEESKTDRMIERYRERTGR